MTETPLPPPPGDTLQDPAPEVRRRLVRHPDDKVVAGVCAAFGRYTSTDPVLWRVLIAALALFGGAGIALYALAWLLVPRSDRPESFVERRLRRSDRSVNVGGVILLFVIVIVLLGLLDDGATFVVLAVVAGLGYLVARERGVVGTPPPADSPWAPTGAASSYGVPAGAPVQAPYAPAAPRPRSALGVLTVSAAALVAGVLLLLRALDVDGITAPRVLAASLLVVGAGLLVGAWWGRARWLIAVGVLLAVVLAPVAAVDGRISGGAGERTWVPTAGSVVPAEYRLGAGEAVLDLRRLEPGALDELRAEVGLGSLLVLVPSDLRVEVTTDLGLGELREAEGTADRSVGRTIGRDEDDVLVVGPGTGPVLDLELRVGVGEIEVRRVRG